MAHQTTPIFDRLLGRPLEGFAPAKLNLTLQIVGRRDDGFHLLQMRNVLLGFGDSVTVRLQAEPSSRSVVGSTEGGGVSLPDDFGDVGRNLASRAADRLLGALGVALGFEITIVKRIPSGAGLGGGSSDAATVLKILVDALRPYGALPSSELTSIALGLGADVPFFLLGQSAIVAGIGEIVVPCSETGLQGIECLVVLPPAVVPTPRAYALFRAAHPVIEERRAPEALLGGWGPPETLVRNDLEKVVGIAFPVVRQVLGRLRSVDGVVAGMTGSGSALFCLPRVGGVFPQGVPEQIAAAAGCPIVRTKILNS